MPRAFSTRRFTLAYALVVAVLVAAGASLLNYRHLQRQELISQQSAVGADPIGTRPDHIEIITSSPLELSSQIGQGDCFVDLGTRTGFVREPETLQRRSLEHTYPHVIDYIIKYSMITRYLTGLLGVILDPLGSRGGPS